MGLLDRFKNLFRRNKAENINALPEYTGSYPQYENPSVVSSNAYKLTREDGTTIEIEPVLDDLGYQSYSQVYNQRTHQMQNIPKFKVMHDWSHGRIRQDEILMDIDPNILNNPEYSQFIANTMLSEDRIFKIINEYGNYAGMIAQDQNGRLGKTIDAGIIKTLNSERAVTANKIEEDRINAENLRNREILERAKQRGVHIETNPEIDLSGQSWER